METIPSVNNGNATGFLLDSASPINSATYQTPQSLKLLQQEEQLARLLLQEVLPPFSSSMQLKALLVYQADQGKPNSLLVNKTYIRSTQDDPSRSVEPSSTDIETAVPSLFESIDEGTLLSDSGFIEPITKTPKYSLPSFTNEQYSNSISTPISESTSKRKRKFCRPCKIPQLEFEVNCLKTESQSPTLSVSTDGLLTATSTTNASHLYEYTSEDFQPSMLSSPSISSSNNRPDTRLALDVLQNENGISQDNMMLPVSAVTLFPHVGVFPLPVSILSNLPRPILPRGVLDKSMTIASSLMYLSALKRSSLSTTTNTTFSGLPTVQSSVNIYNNVKESNSPPKRIAVSPITSRVQQTINMNNSIVAAAISAATKGEIDDNSMNRRFGKSFVCNQCHKDFSSLSLLCAHTFSVHRGFRCTICRAQFTQRSNLQRHSLRHVGFKPFICKVCDKAYYRKDHLVRHIEISHPGCDPRVSLTVKLSSAECLEYLEKRYQESTQQVDGNNAPVQSFSDSPLRLVTTKVDEVQTIKPEFILETEATTNV